MADGYNPEEELLKVLVTDEMVWALKRRTRKGRAEQRQRLLSMLEQKAEEGTLSSVERILWASFKIHPRATEARKTYIQSEFTKLKRRAGEDYRKSLAMLET